MDGRPRRITARGPTKRAALDAARARERAVALTSATAERMTTEQYLQRWLHHKAATVKPRTHREYQQVLRDHAYPAFGHVPLAKLRPQHVQDAVDALARAGKTATAHNARRYLRQALEQAVRWQLTTTNPVAGVANVTPRPIKRGLWTVEQTARFLTSTSDRTWYHPLFVLAIVTGLRQGELIALPWANVRPDGITVDRTWSRDAIVGYDTPKTARAYRSVPISLEVYELLRARHDRTRTALALPTTTGTMASPWNVHRAFVDAITAANRSAPADAQLDRIRFHDLRRIAATLWARQGVEPRVIQQLLGHSTPHLALSVYQGVLDERVAVARLDARMLFGGYAVSGDGHSRVAPDAPTTVPERALN